MFLYTDAAYRRQGIALCLLQECEQQLRDKGVEKIFLEVRSDNMAAQKLYESFDMKVLNRRVKYYEDGCDALIYVKDLRKS
jgi:ribosomal protein S18 acetylase RimI-like enzyme